MSTPFARSLLAAPFAVVVAGCITYSVQPLCHECAEDDEACKMKACVDIDTSTTDPTASTTAPSGTVTTDPTAATTADTSDSTSTSGSTTADTTSGPPCDYDLVCDDADGEDLASCLHDCASCNSNGTCDPDELPYHCPSDCPASACDHDGVLDPFTEHCDDQNLDDSDACTNACTNAACGDGLLYAGVEECDDQNLDPGDGCDPDCKRETLFVFVTSQTFQGNLLPSQDNKTGLALADAHCQALAANASLPGSYKAWLSDGSQGPSSRFGLPPSYPGRFTLTDGSLLALGWQDLTDGSLALPLDRDESANPVSSSIVWTNTLPDGAPASTDHCSSWSSSSITLKGRMGATEFADASWTNFDNTQCASSSRLYCFQVTP